MIRDDKGRERIVLSTEADGRASIEHTDADGRVRIITGTFRGDGPLTGISLVVVLALTCFVAPRKESWDMCFVCRTDRTRSPDYPGVTCSWLAAIKRMSGGEWLLTCPSRNSTLVVPK